MNKVFLIGFLGGDPDLRYSAQGTAFCKFSIAVKETYKGQSKTQWFQIVAWRKLAETCAKYLVKGSKVLVEGHLVNNEYTKDGVKRRFVDVHMDRLEFLDTRGAQGDGGEGPGGEEEELPF
jgi:single-strand DNA-binding protein